MQRAAIVTRFRHFSSCRIPAYVVRKTEWNPFVLVLYRFGLVSLVPTESKNQTLCSRIMLFMLSHDGHAMVRRSGLCQVSPQGREGAFSQV